MSLPPHAFWQDLFPPGTHDTAGPFHDAYPGTLPCGRQILQPIRVLPGDGTRAVASLILNQASFAVQDVIADHLATLWRDVGAEVVVGLPTLGLMLADALARRLGHARMVALGTSRKFWYDDALGVPLRSITTPGGGKTLYLDPRMLPLLRGRRVLVVDDVLSTGASMAAALALLDRAGIDPIGIGAAMAQGAAWRERLGDVVPVACVFATPILRVTPDGCLPA